MEGLDATSGPEEGGPGSLRATVPSSVPMSDAMAQQPQVMFVPYSSGSGVAMQHHIVMQPTAVDQQGSQLMDMPAVPRQDHDVAAAAAAAASSVGPNFQSRKRPRNRSWPIEVVERSFELYADFCRAHGRDPLRDEIMHHVIHKMVAEPALHRFRESSDIMETVDQMMSLLANRRAAVRREAQSGILNIPPEQAEQLSAPRRRRYFHYRRVRELLRDMDAAKVPRGRGRPPKSLISPPGVAEGDTEGAISSQADTTAAAAQAAAVAAAAATTTVAPLVPEEGTSGDGGGEVVGDGGGVGGSDGGVGGGGGGGEGEGGVSTLTTLLRDNVRHTQHVVHQLNTVQQTLGELTEQIARLVGETRRLSGHSMHYPGAQSMGTLLPSQSHAAQAAHAAAQHAAAAAGHHPFQPMPMGENGMRRHMR